MAWSPDVIAGVTIALVLALIGWGGTVYCWIHKKKVSQGEVSTVDKWLAKKGTTGAGFVGAQAGFAHTGDADGGMEMQRQTPRRGGGERDVERDGNGDAGSVASTVVVEGVDTMGEPRAPPPVYDGRRGSANAHANANAEGMGEARRSAEVPGYQERI